VNKKLFLSGGVSDVVDASFEKLKKAPDNVVSEAASKAYSDGNFKLAKKLYDMLCLRKPKNPQYFYSAGLANAQMAQSFDAFPDYVIAWHLQG
ncbi:hypothetical protein ABTQ08_20205, partial [Acinetobacter baumannii]